MDERETKEDIEIKNQVGQQRSICIISSILSCIFTYVDRKDILEFSTVCKKWNSVINPIIYKAIVLNCKHSAFYPNSGVAYNNIKCDAEVVECISNISKHAQFVKEFKYNIKLEPQRTIEFFQTFRFISNLSIGRCDMSQDQFLCMIHPLNQLQELSIEHLSVRDTFDKRSYNEFVQLPSSLKKLRLEAILLMGNPELFIQTINSHRNLVELGLNSYTSSTFLEPFYKHYPSLLNLEYDNRYIQTPQPLLKIFENNSQLISLKLTLGGWSNELVSHIQNYLTSLEHLKFSEDGHIEYHEINTDHLVKFSQPTKIKKLNLNWYKKSSCCLNSILLNFPDLEELDLNPYTKFKHPISDKFLNLSNSSKLKKLSIDCGVLGEDLFNSLLLKCQHLNELTITLPTKWKEVIKSIYERCCNLKRLDIFPPNGIREHMFDIFFLEFYQMEFFTSKAKCKSTLSHLTLNHFNIHFSKAEYFKNFENLRSIKYPKQNYYSSLGELQQIDIDMDMWPSYVLYKKDSERACDFEFKRL
jgi:hypothetical protein